MFNKKAHMMFVLSGLVGLSQVTLAEISGSGSPNSNCAGQLSGSLWHDLNADGVADAGEPGLPQVTMYLFYDDGSTSISATTSADGFYQFSYLCDGDYLAVIDETTVPDGLLLPDTGDSDDDDDDDDSDDDLGGWQVEIDDGEAVVFNRGFSGCDLTVNSSCTVASLASELYRCEKPIDELSLVWDGDQNIKVVAHYGKRDDPVLVVIDNVARGDLVTVPGIAGSSDDVIWEIFAAGTDTKLGESKLRVACDDPEMDGPEDCGLPQGNGKDNKVEFINDWLLEGIVDDSGLLACTNQSVASESCEFQSQWADCELLDKVNWLTFSYTGGGCGVSNNDQPGKFECAGEVDSGAPITVLTESGDSFVVQPGESFTVPTEGGDTDFELSNTLGTEELRIHTSCSEPMAAGDVYGSLTLAALNGIGIGAQIDYEYELDNKRDASVMATTREAPFRTLHQSSVSIDSRAIRRIAGSAYVMATTTSAIVAERPEDANPSCNGADFISVAAIPRAPCEISGTGLQVHNDYIFGNIATGTNVSATIDRIEIVWPLAVTDKLKEIKLNGDKIFDQDRFGGVALIERADLEDDLHKRRIPGNESKELKIVFDDDIDSAALDDFSIEVHFRQGCSISF